MKQHITSQDLEQLSDKGKEKLREWWKPKEGDWICFTTGTKHIKHTVEINSCDSEWGYVIEPGDKPQKNQLPLLSIGQMIEFLDEHNTDRAFDALCFDRGEYEWHVYHLEKPNNHRSVELCNALWSACVEVLNN